jgi:hypothetical protein
MSDEAEVDPMCVCGHPRSQHLWDIGCTSTDDATCQKVEVVDDKTEPPKRWHLALCYCTDFEPKQRKAPETIQ